MGEMGEFNYNVYSVNNWGSAPAIHTNVYKEAMDYCMENKDSDSDYVIYDTNGFVIFDTFSDELGNSGVMGT